MALTVPPGKNYQSPLVAVPSRYETMAKEGPKQISCEFDWTTMGQQVTGTTEYSIYVNLQNNATLEFSQIVSMKIDNSLCGSDVQFVFQDTGEIITIAAYNPLTVVPVFSNSLQFYAVALGALSPDVTRVQLLNFVPYPVAVPTSQEQNSAYSSNIGIIPNGNIGAALIPAGISGTLEALYVNATVAQAPTVAPGASVTINLFDGSGNQFINNAQFNVPVAAAGSNATNPAIQVLRMENIRWRFNNGFDYQLLMSANWPAAGFNDIQIQALYRTP